MDGLWGSSFWNPAFDVLQPEPRIKKRRKPIQESSCHETIRL